jgi:branched-chain amino acid transport system ATP-binding protein
LTEATPYLLETRGLTKEFNGFLAVNNVNLRVRQGTIHALIGPNGAGKTTVFNLISKFHQPSRGQIFYKGRDITSARPEELASRGMVRSFQISAVFPRMTVLENVRIALQNKNTSTPYKFWRAEETLNAFNARAVSLLEAVGLAGAEDHPASELSYGRKRALEIATTLALDPEVLLLDEPMAGMGHEDIGRISALIRKVAEGRTIVMVEHNLSVVADLSHTITVLQRGEILAEGSYAEVSNNPQVRQAYMGSGTIAKH